MYHLMEGLSLKVKDCADVLDHCLLALNEKTRIPEKNSKWNGMAISLVIHLCFPNMDKL